LVQRQTALLLLDIERGLADHVLVATDIRCSSLRAFFSIRVSPSFLSQDHRKAHFSTYPWLTFRGLGQGGSIGLQ
jgi:hypothetical protein